jgi:hypothetical protein
MFVPHRKYIYRPLRPVTGIDLSLYLDEYLFTYIHVMLLQRHSERIAAGPPVCYPQSNGGCLLTSELPVLETSLHGAQTHGQRPFRRLQPCMGLLRAYARIHFISCMCYNSNSLRENIILRNAGFEVLPSAVTTLTFDTLCGVIHRMQSSAEHFETS